MKVGFIGLGHMGFGMAENLLRAGHDLTVYNRTPGKDEVLLQKGAHRAHQAAAACRGEAVFTMLADDRAVESVLRGRFAPHHDERLWRLVVHGGGCGACISELITRPVLQGCCACSSKL